MPSVAISSVMPSWLTSLPQHQPLDQPGQHDHHAERGDEGQHVAEQLALDAGQLRNPFGEARHRQRREQHHRALREIEHARGLEDQHEAERDQRIQHARPSGRRSGFRGRTGPHVSASGVRQQGRRK